MDRDSMTMADFREAKKKAMRTVKAAVMAFHEETGLKITEIQLTFVGLDFTFPQKEGILTDVRILTNVDQG